MILAGFLIRKKGLIDQNGTRTLSYLLTNVVYPPSIVASLVGNYTIKGVLDGWLLPFSEFLLFAVGFVVGAIVIRFFPGRSQGERRMFHYQSTLMNFLFLPLPLIMSMFGDRGVAVLSLAYVGGEASIWTIGVVAISGGFSLKEMRKIFSMPMCAIILAVVIMCIRDFLPSLCPASDSYAGITLKTLLDVAKTFGAGTIGISMIVAGSNMANLKAKNLFAPFHLVLLSLRLIVVPAIAIAIFHFLPLTPENRLILSIVAMMPSSVSSVAYGEYFNADSQTAAIAIMLSHIGCIITIPIWLAIIS